MNFYNKVFENGFLQEINSIWPFNPLQKQVRKIKLHDALIVYQSKNEEEKAELLNNFPKKQIKPNENESALNFLRYISEEVNKNNSALDRSRNFIIERPVIPLICGAIFGLIYFIRRIFNNITLSFFDFIFPMTMIIAFIIVNILGWSVWFLKKGSLNKYNKSLSDKLFPIRKIQLSFGYLLFWIIMFTALGIDLAVNMTNEVQISYTPKMPMSMRISFLDFVNYFLPEKVQLPHRDMYLADSMNKYFELTSSELENKFIFVSSNNEQEFSREDSIVYFNISSKSDSLYFIRNNVVNRFKEGENRQIQKRIGEVTKKERGATVFLVLKGDISLVSIRVRGGMIQLIRADMNSVLKEINLEDIRFGYTYVFDVLNENEADEDLQKMLTVEKIDALPFPYRFEKIDHDDDYIYRWFLFLGAQVMVFGILPHTLMIVMVGLLLVVCREKKQLDQMDSFKEIEKLFHDEVKIKDGQRILIPEAGNPDDITSSSHLVNLDKPIHAKKSEKNTTSQADATLETGKGKTTEDSARKTEVPELDRKNQLAEIINQSESKQKPEKDTRSNKKAYLASNLTDQSDKKSKDKIINSQINTEEIKLPPTVDNNPFTKKTYSVVYAQNLQDGKKTKRDSDLYVFNVKTRRDAVLKLNEEDVSELNFFINLYRIPDVPSSEFFNELITRCENVKVFFSNAHDEKSKANHDLWVKYLNDLNNPKIKVH